MFAAVARLWGLVPDKIKSFLTNSLIALACAAAVVAVLWFVDKRGYDRGVTDTELKYAQAVGEQQTTTIKQNQQAHQWATTRSDTERRCILSHWMRPVPEKNHPCR